MRRRVSRIRSLRECLWFPYRHHAGAAQPDRQGAGRGQGHLEQSTSAAETLYHACRMQRIASLPQLTWEGQQKVMELAQRYEVSAEAVVPSSRLFCTALGRWPSSTSRT